MNMLLTLPCDIAQRPEAGADATVTAEDKVRRQVWRLLAGFYPPGKWTERRREHRFPLPRLIYLTPVERDGITPLSQSLVVVGKDLSERGLGFFHPQPLAFRRMVASIETQGGDWVGFMIDINWCRFTQHGWYDSGGRFLHVMATEKGAPRGTAQSGHAGSI